MRCKDTEQSGWQCSEIRSGFSIEMLGAYAPKYSTGAVLHAQEVDTLHLSTLYTTHVVVRSNLVYADLSNTRLVAAKIVDQNRTMLALKAREPFDVPSSVSALESDGITNTFVVAYREHSDQLVVDMRGNRQQKSGPTSEMVPECSFEKHSQRIFHIG